MNITTYGIIIKQLTAYFIVLFLYRLIGGLYGYRFLRRMGDFSADQRRTCPRKKQVRPELVSIIFAARADSNLLPGYSR